MTKALLFMHLVSAFLLVAGATVAGVAQISALRRERPSEIVLLLRLARPGVALVNLGALGTLAFGIALAERLAAEGDHPSEELRSLVSHRPSLLLSYASTAAIVAILVLMVWKPGS